MVAPLRPDKDDTEAKITGSNQWFFAVAGKLKKIEISNDRLSLDDFLIRSPRDFAKCLANCEGHFAYEEHTKVPEGTALGGSGRVVSVESPGWLVSAPAGRGPGSET
jgi:hypothetical protein